MATIHSIQPDGALPTEAFLEHCKAKVPAGAAVVVAWVNEDGAPEFLCNNTLRRDWAWLGAWITRCAMRDMENG